MMHCCYRGVQGRESGGQLRVYKVWRELGIEKREGSLQHDSDRGNVSAKR